MEAPCFDSLDLYHNPHLHLLYHRWQGHCNMHRFRPAMKYVLWCLRTYAIESWIIDFNGLPNIGLEDQVWLGNRVLPTEQHLPHVRRLALVLDAASYNQLVAEQLFSFEEPNHCFEIQFFADATSALEWVVECTQPNPSHCRAA